MVEDIGQTNGAEIKPAWKESETGQTQGCKRVIGEVNPEMAINTTRLRGVLKSNEPLSRHTSWRVGGLVDRFYQPADLDDLAMFLAQLDKDEPVYWLGLGSNLLVRDGGYRGTMICTSGVLNELHFVGDGRVVVEAGVACPKVARQCAKQGLSGAEFLSGIPGTLGGALAMNAGAFGGETWDIVEQVSTIDRKGQRHERLPGEFVVSYRHVEGVPGEWFVTATLQLTSGDAQQSQEKIRQLLAKRGASQPTQQPTAGSVFRNPQGDYAARLIDSCGLKGTCVGGACVSERHANFIVNTGTATAADIETLIEKVASVVKQEHGVDLIREVCIVGEHASQAGEV